MNRGLGFVGGTFDRADQVRADPQALFAARRQPDARVLRLDGIAPVVDGEGGLVWDPVAPPGSAPDAPLILLGIDGNAPRFAVVPPPGTRIDARSRSVMRLLPMLSVEDAAHYAAARSLVDWHARHGFCAACGADTAPAKGGWQRTCSACGAEHFPRVDPVVIMLAVHGDRALVGRQPGYPPRLFSALAGFVEPGESLEEAVARELWEEAGVRATSVAYVASQPWPFPSSLMIGCMAQVADPTLTIDTTELETAVWISRGDARAALDNASDAPFAAPPPLAIAHHLLRHWAEQAGDAGA